MPRFSLFTTFLFVLGLLGFALVSPVKAFAATYYVSKNGSNAGGTSWTTAWNELNQINWGQVNPGDTVYLDGGATQMTYTTTLAPAKSGTVGSPITIMLAPDAGRNGQVVIFGGRLALLPYCQQTTYVYQTQGVRLVGIDLLTSSYVVVDGSKWRGILVTGHNDHGVKLSGSNNTLRNMEITDNGNANFNSTANYWRPDMPGLQPGGTGNTLDQVVIHDNGQDALQTGSAVQNFTIRRSWFYNGRSHPVYGNAVPFNYCMHSDGFQIYGGGTSSRITFESSILGPGFMQGTILGQSGAQSARVNNVTFTNTLIIGNFNASIMGYSQTNSRNWTVNHVTSYIARSPNWNIPSGTGSPGNVVGTGWNEVTALYGSGHTISNTIAYDGRVLIPAGTTFSNNCQYKLISGTINGANADPQFTSPPPATVPDATTGNNATIPTSPTLQDFINADYSLKPASPCAGRGSAITSVAQLLGANPPSPSPAPTPTPTPLITCNISDINRDGVANAADLGILITDFFKTQGFNPGSDINSDGIVDVSDYSLLVKNYQVQTGVCQ